MIHCTKTGFRQTSHPLFCTVYHDSDFENVFHSHIIIKQVIFETIKTYCHKKQESISQKSNNTKANNTKANNTIANNTIANNTKANNTIANNTKAK